VPDVDVIGEALPLLLRGLVTTVEITVVSAVIALVLSFVLGLALLSGNRIVRGAARTWVEIFRGTSALIQLFYFYFVLPGLLGITISPFVAAVAALSINTGAYGSEIVRSAIRAVPPGQREAAVALGMSYRQTMRFVILPQGLRRMVPATVSQLITLNKDTTLVSLIAFQEVIRRGRSVIANAGNPFTGSQVDAPILEVFLFIGLLFIVVNLLLSRLSRRLEIRERRRSGTKLERVSGLEDQAAAPA